MDAVGIPLTNAELVLVYTKAFLSNTGPFDYPDYLLPASENSGYIAISVSF